jgi:hypothetical protein
MTILTRRLLLVGGLSAGALAASVGGVSATAPAPTMRVLAVEELEVVKALAEAMFPKGPIAVSGLEAGVPFEVDRILSEILDEPAALGFRGILRSIEWGSYASRMKRFSRLTIEERREVLDVWASPSVLARRVASDALKAVMGMAYFGSPLVQAEIGWRPICGGGLS